MAGLWLNLSSFILDLSTSVGLCVKGSRYGVRLWSVCLYFFLSFFFSNLQLSCSERGVGKGGGNAICNSSLDKTVCTVIMHYPTPPSVMRKTPPSPNQGRGEGGQVADWQPNGQSDVDNGGTQRSARPDAKDAPANRNSEARGRMSNFTLPVKTPGNLAGCLAPFRKLERLQLSPLPHPLPLLLHSSVGDTLSRTRINYSRPL